MKPLIKYSVILLTIIVLSLFYIYNSGVTIDVPEINKIDENKLRSGWKKISEKREGKIVYADPPDMIIIDLNTGKRKKINGISIEGGKGRRNRGKTPRPSWSPDGSFFTFRYAGSIFKADESGIKKRIFNERMDISNETRWSVVKYNGKYHVFGPSKNRKGIAVSIDDPEEISILFPYPLIGKHSEITYDCRFIVFGNKKGIFVADLSKGSPGIKISVGQNCRPCASPSSFAAWLPAHHSKYNIHNIKNGEFIKALNAPQNEEIYRLNWSNDENYAVHMFGSRGNTKMYIRKISSGESLFIGYGWDPDLWISKDQ